MPRETAAQRRTRIEMLLADYDARNRELRKLEKEVDTLKEEIQANVPVGTYGEWIRSSGTPRELLDQQAVREQYKSRGEEIPTKKTAAPIVVTHIETAAKKK